MRNPRPDVLLVNGVVASRGIAQAGSDSSNGAALRIPDGYVYILGDNVQSSVDSRSLGLLPKADVLGKVAAVVKRPW